MSHSSSVAGALANSQYTFDAASQISSYTGPEGTLNYTYDPTGQLTGVSGARTETFTVDKNGNRTLAGYVTATGNRLTTDGTYNYVYDNEGNLTSKTRIADGQRTEFTWDYRNRLTKVQVKDAAATVTFEERFTYDLHDRRISTWVDPDGAGPLTGVQSWTAYDGDNPYADFDGSGSLTSRYLYGPALDALLARRDASGNVVWYLGDILGSVRLVVNTSGGIQDQISYFAFGGIASETNPANGDRFKFSGREFDANLGIYNYRNRWFDAGTGRFMSEDPTKFQAGDPNFYRYVFNSPTNGTDRTGLDRNGAFGGIAGGFFAVPAQPTLTKGKGPG